MPYGVASDAKGNVFIANGNAVLRVDAATGLIAPVAGNGTAGFGGDDGLATSAQLNQPFGIALDSAGVLYISDTGNARIRRVANGIITTIAGSAKPGFSGDNGPATAAQLSQPQGLAVDSAGNVYIADTGNQRVREVSKGVITTLAGTGLQGFTGDGGAASDARLYNPTGVAVDSAGNIYIADAFNNRVRVVSNGTITTVAGNGRVSPGTVPGPPGPGLPPTGGFSGDGGAATDASLYVPGAVAVDAAGNLFIADQYNGRIREVTNGTINTVAGSGGAVGGQFPSGGNSSGDGGTATSARFIPLSIAVDGAGNIYIGDGGGNGFGTERIRKVANGAIASVAGSGKPTTFFSGDGGLATAAKLRTPSGVAVDKAGNVYIADTSNQRIRKVSNGVITTIAGNGFAGFTGDGGPALNAEFNQPMGLAVDTAGNVYVADSSNNRIREISGGIITTVAGSGSTGFSGDGGQATSAGLYNPLGVAVDAAGNIFIADSYNNRVREVSKGIITTVAGNGVLAPGNGIPGGRGYGGFSGDGAAATDAQMSTPNSVTVDAAGNIYISDYDNYRVRKVANRIITTVAGVGPNGGFGGFGGDGGLATAAQLNGVTAIAVDPADNIYISDAGNVRVRMVSGGIVTTIAGTGAGGVSGDNGPAAGATFNGERGIAVDAASHVYIGDSLNDRVRVLTPGTKPVIAPSGVVPVFSSVSLIQPGSWISIFGTELAASAVVWNGDFPTSLGGTSVTIDNKPAYLWFVSPTQINLQVPDGVSAGLVSVAVSAVSGAGASTVKVGQQAPSLSMLGDGRHVAAEIATPDGTGAYGGGSYDLVGPLNTFSYNTRPVKAGEVLTLYGVGFGSTFTPVPAGQPFSGSSPTFSPVAVTIGGVPATVTYSGIVQAGLYQINLTVPAAPSGDQAVVASVNDVLTPAGPVVTMQ
jgi:uncharacterized protein (TIGR03437 family)